MVEWFLGTSFDINIAQLILIIANLDRMSYFNSYFEVHRNSLYHSGVSLCNFQLHYVLFNFCKSKFIKNSYCMLLEMPLEKLYDNQINNFDLDIPSKANLYNSPATSCTMTPLPFVLLIQSTFLIKSVTTSFMALV